MNLPIAGSLVPGGAVDQAEDALRTSDQGGRGRQHRQDVTDLVVRPIGVLLVVIVAIVVARLGSKAVRRSAPALRRSGDHPIELPRTGPASRPCPRSRPICGGSSSSSWPWPSSSDDRGQPHPAARQRPPSSAPHWDSAPSSSSADYLSGFLLTVEDQYGIGDAVTIGAVSGVVEDLTLRVDPPARRRRDGLLRGQRATSACWPTRRGAGPMPCGSHLRARRRRTSPGPARSSRRWPGGWPAQPSSPRTPANLHRWSLHRFHGTHADLARHAAQRAQPARLRSHRALREEAVGELSGPSVAHTGCLIADGAAGCVTRGPTQPAT